MPVSVQRPVYDRSRLKPGILHIGLGNFHRAHQAWFVHSLMQQGEAMDWGIIGAGVRPADETRRQQLSAQDYLTTLIKLDPAGCTAEIIGSMIDFVPVQQNNAALIAQMSDPAIRIVSLTVTEGGYYVDPVHKGLDAGHPDINYDALHPEQPGTAFGAMVEALKRRRAAGVPPFTGLSCDNLQGNGDILRQTLVSLARLSDPDHATWIDAHVTFPNSMVDCIVPATGSREIELARTFGVEDAAPVTHENFRQWVIEDKFCMGRPDLEKVGATFTDNVHDFEVMKIRILNGGHQLIADAGEILSVESISGCMQDPSIGPFFNKVAKSEIVPHINPVPGMTPLDYVELIDRRFSNPRIIDTVRRVAFDGSSRQTGFVLPTLREALALQKPMDGLALSQAIWARMCEGSREDGSIIEPNDPFWPKLMDRAKASKTDPQAWLNQTELYGDLGENALFRDRFHHWFNLIWLDGLKAAIQAYLKR